MNIYRFLAHLAYFRKSIDMEFYNMYNRIENWNHFDMQPDYDNLKECLNNYICNLEKTVAQLRLDFDLLEKNPPK